MARTSMMLDAERLASLFGELVTRGYRVHGPRVQNGVIVVEELDSIDDLPIGWTDVQAPGTYRLERRGDEARFGYAVGPSSWKPLLQPPREQVWQMHRDTDGEVRVHMVEPTPPKRAFFGVRPCELAAIQRQDTVLARGPHPDPSFVANRRTTFVLAVNCGTPAATCFCTSMGSGPAAEDGFDIVLTELVDDDTEVGYLALAGSDLGEELMDALGDVPVATPADVDRAHQVTAHAADLITRRLDAGAARSVLYDSMESPIWDDIAERCLTCANCTMVCPTCFCTDLVDTTDLSGDHTERWRQWDSCFSLEYSHLGPGPHRASAKSRYRQWMTHKLASWIDQFDESGCVGCGRCITWCPVGIDLTAELGKFQAELVR